MYILVSRTENNNFESKIIYARAQSVVRQLLIIISHFPRNFVEIICKILGGSLKDIYFDRD